MTGHWPSTKGLSVYNALKLGGAMAPLQIAEYLREHWDTSVTDDYVADGIAFIAEKGWVRQDESGQLSRTHSGFHAVRTAEDSDLRLEANRT
jgi:hypothetical protein